MNTNKVLTSFIIDNFKDSLAPTLLYKDKQFLKEEKYEEFAKEQLKRNKWAMTSVAFPVFYGMFYAIQSLLGYAETGNLYLLTFSITVLFAMLLATYFSTKQYYTIKSSMTLFLKLLENGSIQDQHLP